MGALSAEYRCPMTDIRPVTEGDFDAVFDLLTARSRAAFGISAEQPAFLRQRWDAPATDNWVAVANGAVVGYAGLSFFGVAWETAIQDHVPHRSLGKVASWDQLTSFIAMPVGNALAGPLAQAYGINPVLVACAMVFLVASLAPLFVRGSRNLTRGDPEVAIPAEVLPPEIRAGTA